MAETRSVRVDGDTVHSEIIIKESFSRQKAEEVLKVLAQRIDSLEIQGKNDVRQLNELKNQLTKSRISRKRILEIQKIQQLAQMLDQIEQIKLKIKHNKEEKDKIQNDRIILAKALLKAERKNEKKKDSNLQ